MNMKMLHRIREGGEREREKEKEKERGRKRERESGLGEGKTNEVKDGRVGRV